VRAPQLSALEELRVAVRRSQDYSEESPIFDHFNWALNDLMNDLVLPRLRCLLCYAADFYDGARPLPWRFGSSPPVAQLASTLEELAIVDFEGPAGLRGLVFPRLRRMHASSFPTLDPNDPSHFARTFPALEEVLFSGDSQNNLGRCMGGLPFPALPLLPGLRAVSLHRLCGHGPPDGGAFAHLGRCGALTSLRMHGVTHVGLEDVLQAACAPRLRRISLEGCIFLKQQPQPSALQAALRAAAGPARALDVAVSDARSPAPYGLLPDGYGRGEWWHADATSC
jgi:hypothetical protein